MTALLLTAGNRAATREEIAPLVALCRAGRLFDVQAWIASGKPVNPPPKAPKGARIKSPLDVALETGFHSMVDVLLRAGALQEPQLGYGSPLSRALAARRLDIIELLVEFGCDPRSVDLSEILSALCPAGSVAASALPPSTVHGPLSNRKAV
jgi:hypothetical protein